MEWICIMAVTLAMTGSAVAAQAATSDCPVPPGAVNVALPSGLPPALRDALPDDIALPGEPFDTTDVYVKGHYYAAQIEQLFATVKPGDSMSVGLAELEGNIDHCIRGIGRGGTKTVA